MIETFIAGVGGAEDIMSEWHDYVVKQREAELLTIITEEKLKPKHQATIYELHPQDNLSMAAEPKNPYGNLEN